MTTPTNGWSRYEQLVLFRLDGLEKAAKERDRQAEERHQCLLGKVEALRSEMTEFKAGRRLQWFKVAGVSFVVAYAVAHGMSLWDLLRGLL